MKIFHSSLIWKLLLLIIVALLALSFGDADVGVKGISGCDTNIDAINTEF